MGHFLKTTLPFLIALVAFSLLATVGSSQGAEKVMNLFM